MILLKPKASRTGKAILNGDYKMINELIKLATHLDSKGLAKEANYLDAVIKKQAMSYTRQWSAGEVLSEDDAIRLTTLEQNYDVCRHDQINLESDIGFFKSLLAECKGVSIDDLPVPEQAV